MSEDQLEYITDAMTMMGIVEPKKIVQETSGWIPVFEAILTHYKDHTTAIVFGRRWQYCRMSDGVCRASLSKIARDLQIDEATVMRHTEKLVNDGFLIDLTPDRRNRPHVYADAGRVVMKSSLSATVAQSNTGIAQRNAGIAQSQLIKQDNTKKNNPSPLKTQTHIQGIEAAMMAGRPVTEADLPEWELREKAAISAFESALGIPANWNWYPSKSTEEKTWRDFRAYLVKLFEADNQCFAKYQTWRTTPFARDTMGNLQIKRFPENFPTSWTAFLASEMYIGKVSQSDAPKAFPTLVNGRVQR